MYKYDFLCFMYRILINNIKQITHITDFSYLLFGLPIKTNLETTDLLTHTFDFNAVSNIILKNLLFSEH